MIIGCIELLQQHEIGQARDDRAAMFLPMFFQDFLYLNNFSFGFFSNYFICTFLFRLHGCWHVGLHFDSNGVIVRLCSLHTGKLPDGAADQRANILYLSYREKHLLTNFIVKSSIPSLRKSRVSTL